MLILLLFAITKFGFRLAFNFFFQGKNKKIEYKKHKENDKFY